MKRQANPNIIVPKTIKNLLSILNFEKKANMILSIKNEKGGIQNINPTCKGLK